MGRYRPPAEKKSPYITEEGMLRLKQEEKQLWERRREVVTALAAAAAEGDRSENAEYIYRKKELRELDRRIRYLQKRLPDLTVVANPPANTDKVYFAAWVVLEDENGDELEYRIVGPDEFDQHQCYISMDAPLARALMSRALDDDVEFNIPAGVRYYTIVEIRY